MTHAYRIAHQAQQWARWWPLAAAIATIAAMAVACDLIPGHGDPAKWRDG